jgi:hypothetical protein
LSGFDFWQRLRVFFSRLAFRAHTNVYDVHREIKTRRMKLAGLITPMQAIIHNFASTEIMLT